MASTSKSVIKCVIVGDKAVGKTCLLKSYATNNFSLEYTPTTIFDYYNADVVVNGSTINLSLWDSPGEEDYDRFRPQNYSGVDVILLAFSLTSKATYNNASNKWLRELKRYAPTAPIVLVGTKLDIRYNGVTLVTTAQGENLKKRVGAKKYIECSANTQQNVKSVFEAAAEAVLNSNSPTQKKRKSEPKCACTIL